MKIIVTKLVGETNEKQRVRSMAVERNWQHIIEQMSLSKILTEAEEEGVDTHAIHTKEAMGNKVGSYHNRLQKGKKNNKKKTE